jgi:two-component system, chemotaxis family, chemotaxis protein CheY
MTVDIRKLKILVIEDDDFTRKVIKIALRNFACQNILEASDGAEGFDKFQIDSFQSESRRIDLIICDLSMPVMDGFGFIEQVRNSSKTHTRETPIIVLTGDSKKENLLRAIELGINGFLSKPITPAALEKQIVRALSEPPIPGPNA